jgi:hypothetical protein
MNHRRFSMIACLAPAMLCLTIAVADATSWHEPYNNALRLHRQGNDAQALEPAKLALDLAEKGELRDRYRIVKSLNLLAALNKAMGELSEAERLYARSSAMQARILGPTHPNTVVSMVALADTCAVQGKCHHAESLYLTAMGVCHQLGWKNDPAEADALSGLGSICVTQGRDKEAEALLARAANLYEFRIVHQPNISTKLAETNQRLSDVRRTLQARAGKPMALGGAGEVSGAVR